MTWPGAMSKGDPLQTPGTDQEVLVVANESEGQGKPSGYVRKVNKTDLAHENRRGETKRFLLRPACMLACGLQFVHLKLAFA